MQEITITKQFDQMRIDSAISKILGISRNQAQKLIKDGSILMHDEEKVKSGYRVSADEVFVLIKEPEVKTKKGSVAKLDIVYENDDVLVVQKPSGLLVHQANEFDLEVTLADSLLAEYPELKEVGEDVKRPGIVHRLDKAASGLMIVAKNQNSFEHLKRQFINRKVKKVYTSLVYGSLINDFGKIDFKIARSKTRGHMVARPSQSDQEGKEAITHYDVLKRLKTTTLVKASIETGRTHQIRVHFFAIDHPVVGDTIYKKRHMKNIRPIELDRLFLHASELEIALPDGERKKFTSSLPSELEKLLKELES